MPSRGVSGNQSGRKYIVLETESPGHQRISIPAHKAAKIGTGGSILKAVASHKGVIRDNILRSLLTQTTPYLFPQKSANLLEA